MAILISHSRGYAFAWHIIGKSWYLPSDKVNDYLVGDLPPNYPVPATLLNADVATTHRWLCGHCPNADGPCNVCIDEFIDAMEYYQHPFFELT